MASPEEGSCNSSHASNKSEKNVADFDGEDGLSEEELAHLSEQARHSHRQHFSDAHIHHHHHLASMASLCHKPTVGKLTFQLSIIVNMIVLQAIHMFRNFY